MEASHVGTSQDSMKTNQDPSRDDSSAPDHQHTRHEELFCDVGKHVDGLTLSSGRETNQDTEDGPKMVEEIESLCMNCEKNGITRLLLTKIPYFREIILMSFSCEHCHFRNTEIQSAGQIQEQGASTTLVLQSLKDMERQIVKSDTAEIFLQELDITIPPGQGKLTNIEGLLSEVLRDLEGDQDWRKQHEPETWAQIDSLTQRLDHVIHGQSFPFTIKVDDIAGNSFMEPLESDAQGVTYIRKTYPRDAEANEKLGLFAQDKDDSSEETKGPAHNDAPKSLAHIVPQLQADDARGMEDVDILENQRYTLDTNCPGCSRKAEMNIQMVKIPFFKQVVLSAVSCDFCGYRTSDVKSGGEVSEMGTRMYLNVKSPVDICRDILKSESCLLKIPACGVEVIPGTMGGRFTTVEGLLTQIRDDLRAQIFDIGDGDRAGGDSMETAKKKAWDKFFAKMDLAIRGEMEYTVILEDPLSNSYVQSLCAPNLDPQLKTELYKRTVEEEDELGLTDMRTRQGTDGEYVKEDLEKNPQTSERHRQRSGRSETGDEGTFSRTP